MSKVKISGIYCIENKINHHKYIGQAVDLYARMTEHHDNCTVLLNAINLYGKDNFKFYIVLKLPKIRWILNFMETFFIIIFHSHVSKGGYNILWGGDTPPMLGRHHTDETKRKIIENQPDMSGKNCPQFGKHPSKETREKISNSLLGERHPNYGKKSKDNTSKYYGVCKSDDYYTSTIVEKGRQIFIAKRKLELDAARAYDNYIIKNNLNRPLNFPDSKNETLKIYKNEKKGKRCGASSKYFGVFLNKDRNKWVAHISINWRTIYIGIYENEIDAAKSYDKYVLENNLDKPLNFK